jgi:hypothetical protein
MKEPLLMTDMGTIMVTLLVEGICLKVNSTDMTDIIPIETDSEVKVFLNTDSIDRSWTTTMQAMIFMETLVDLNSFLDDNPL